MKTPRRLALFDLDYTLIPFDSGHAWTRYLISQGRLPPEFEAGYRDFGRQYARGTLNFDELHRWVLAPFATTPVEQIAQWRSAFAAELPARIPREAVQLLQQHQDTDDLCSIVTATARFVCEPFAQA